MVVTKSLAFAGVLLSLCSFDIVAAQDPSWSAAGAEAVFKLAQDRCEADAGRLWGVSLCGPILVADPATRRLFANQDGLEQPLQRDGAVFAGRLDDDVAIANTAIDWNGRRWTMLAAPWPKMGPELATLVMHEAWHRVQKDVGLPAANAEQDHLASEVGRTSLRLELRALKAAFEARDPAARDKAAVDALMFRAWRYAAFPKASDAEAVMEKHEGMAEYTGRRLSGDANGDRSMAERLAQGDRVEAFARSFAYFTGPAYGLLLDKLQPDWREVWDRQDGPAQLLSKALNVNMVDVATPSPAPLKTYGGKAVADEEAASAAQQRRFVAQLRDALINKPVLIAPVAGAAFSFNPNLVTPLPPDGSVYQVIRVAAPWGVLDVKGGGLLSPDWTKLTVSAHGSRKTLDGLESDDWKLTLKPGWIAAAGERSGDHVIRPNSTP